MKVESGTVHAVPQPGGLGTIVKDMAEMAAASAAMHLGAGHEKAAVGLRLDGVVDRCEEARPACPAVELGIRGKQWLAATGTVVNARAILLIEQTGAGAFGAVLAQHSVRRWRKPTPPVLFAHRDREFLDRRMSSAAEAAQQAFCHGISSQVYGVRRKLISDRQRQP
jgi:hypothetical protein